MSSIPTQANEIIVDTPESIDMRAFVSNDGSKLVSWVVDRVDQWEDVRDRGYAIRWGEYWRMWRGYVTEEDKNRQSERSRLVTPALAQAIEQTVAELEEAIFSREAWFDLADDIADQQKVDAMLARDNLLEDFELVNAPDQISEAILNGAIFGTGVVFLNVDTTNEKKLIRNEQQKLVAQSRERVRVAVESVRPDQFIPDPGATAISDMLGVARKIQKPYHYVLEKITSGVYRKDALAGLRAAQRMENNDIDQDDPESMLTAADAEQVTITEYHGDRKSVV